MSLTIPLYRFQLVEPTSSLAARVTQPLFVRVYRVETHPKKMALSRLAWKLPVSRSRCCVFLVFEDFIFLSGMTT